MDLHEIYKKHKDKFLESDDFKNSWNYDAAFKMNENGLYRNLYGETDNEHYLSTNNYINLIDSFDFKTPDTAIKELIVFKYIEAFSYFRLLNTELKHIKKLTVLFDKPRTSVGCTLYYYNTAMIGLSRLYNVPTRSDTKNFYFNFYNSLFVNETSSYIEHSILLQEITDDKKLLNHLKVSYYIKDENIIIKYPKETKLYNLESFLLNNDFEEIIKKEVYDMFMREIVTYIFKAEIEFSKFDVRYLDILDLVFEFKRLEKRKKFAHLMEKFKFSQDSDQNIEFIMNNISILNMLEY